MNPKDSEQMEPEPDGCDRPNGHFSKTPVYIVCSYVKFNGKEAGQGCYFKQRLYYYLVLIFFLFYYCLNLAFK